MVESKTLRGNMFKSREQARNQMYSQCQFVEMIMRRRVFDIQRARNEMEWQKYKVSGSSSSRQKVLILTVQSCTSTHETVYFLSPRRKYWQFLYYKKTLKNVLA